MALQAQRIPLGTVTVGGRQLPVYITIEWLKVLQSLDTTVTTVVVDGTGSSGSSPEDAIDLPYDEAAAVKVLAIGLQRAVAALEADNHTAAVLARLASLEARIGALEQAP